MNSSENTTELYQKIKDRCDALGINISELSRLSNVDRQMFNNWKNKIPKSIVSLDKINTVLDRLEAEQQAEQIKSAFNNNK